MHFNRKDVVTLPQDRADKTHVEVEGIRLKTLVDLRLHRTRSKFVPGRTNTGNTQIDACDLDSIQVGHKSIIVIHLKHDACDVGSVRHIECLPHHDGARTGRNRCLIVAVAVADSTLALRPGTFVEAEITPVGID